MRHRTRRQHWRRLSDWYALLCGVCLQGRERRQHFAWIEYSAQIENLVARGGRSVRRQYSSGNDSCQRLNRKWDWNLRLRANGKVQSSQRFAVFATGCKKPFEWGATRAGRSVRLPASGSRSHKAPEAISWLRFWMSSDSTRS